LDLDREVAQRQPLLIKSELHDQGRLAPASRLELFAVPSRRFDLDQVERAFKTPSAYVCMYVRGGSFGCPF